MVWPAEREARVQIEPRFWIEDTILSDISTGMSTGDDPARTGLGAGFACEGANSLTESKASRIAGWLCFCMLYRQALNESPRD